MGVRGARIRTHTKKLIGHLFNHFYLFRFKCSNFPCSCLAVEQRKGDKQIGRTVRCQVQAWRKAPQEAWAGGRPPGWPGAWALASLGLPGPQCSFFLCVHTLLNRGWGKACWERQPQGAEVRGTGRVAFHLRTSVPPCFGLCGDAAVLLCSPQVLQSLGTQRGCGNCPSPHLPGPLPVQATCSLH